MNITKTRNQLIQEAADKLQIVGTGQALEAEYFDKLNNNVDPLLMQLAADGMCEVVNDGFIPSEWFDSISGLLANICAPIAGKAFDPNIKIYYENNLKRLTASGPSYAIQESEYF